MASAALANGANIKDLSETLGHSSASITLGVYAHVTQESRRAMLAMVADVLSAEMAGEMARNALQNEGEARSA